MGKVFLSSTTVLNPSSISSWLFILCRKCHYFPLAKLAHGSALFPWIRSLVLFILLSWGSLGQNRQHSLGGFAAAARSVDWNHGGFPRHSYCLLERRQDLLLQVLKTRIFGPDLASAKTLMPPKCTHIFKPSDRLLLSIEIRHRKWLIFYTYTELVSNLSLPALFLNWFSPFLCSGLFWVKMAQWHKGVSSTSPIHAGSFTDFHQRLLGFTSDNLLLLVNGAIFSQH